MINVAHNGWTTKKKTISASVKALQIKFTFISSKVVYFMKQYASIAPTGNEIYTAIRSFISLPNNLICIKSNGTATPNMVKGRLEKSAIWVYLKRQLK